MKPQIITAIPVPFTSAGELDTATYTRAVEFLSPHIDGILVAGTTGEFLALDDDERLDLFRITRDTLGAERTIAHLGHASSHQVNRLAQQTLDLGIDRMALISPYYLPSDGPGVVEFYASTMRAVPQAKLYAYLFPERTGMHVAPETLAEVMSIDGIVGVKLSGAANDHRKQYGKVLKEGQELHSGNDAILPEVIAQGGHGVVSGVSSVFPELFARLSNALEHGMEYSDIQERVEEVVALTGPNIRFLKVGLEARLGGEWHSRMSIPTPSASMVDQIRAAVAEHGR